MEQLRIRKTDDDVLEVAVWIVTHQSGRELRQAKREIDVRARVIDVPECAVAVRIRAKGDPTEEKRTVKIARLRPARRFTEPALRQADGRHERQAGDPNNETAEA